MLNHNRQAIIGPSIEAYDGDVPGAIGALRSAFAAQGTSLVQAAFEHSFFADPEAVRKTTVVFPRFVRHSRDYYGPGLDPISWTV